MEEAEDHVAVHPITVLMQNGTGYVWSAVGAHTPNPLQYLG